MSILQSYRRASRCFVLHVLSLWAECWPNVGHMVLNNCRIRPVLGRSIATDFFKRVFTLLHLFENWDLQTQSHPAEFANVGFKIYLMLHKFNKFQLHQRSVNLPECLRFYWIVSRSLIVRLIAMLVFCYQTVRFGAVPRCTYLVGLKKRCKKWIV